MADIKIFEAETPMTLTVEEDAAMDRTFTGESEMIFLFEAITEMDRSYPKDTSLNLEE